MCVVGDDDQSIYKFPRRDSSRISSNSKSSSRTRKPSVWSRTTARPATF
ncbi:MAG: hypothetical protein ACLR4Z_06415 [Butyricicoccaceae bacterium]